MEHKASLVNLDAMVQMELQDNLVKMENLEEMDEMGHLVDLDYVENLAHKNFLFHFGIWPFSALNGQIPTRILSFDQMIGYMLTLTFLTHYPTPRN